jgi:hypothetical protein
MPPLDRRRFLAAGGLLAVAATACSGGSKKGDGSAVAPPTTAAVPHDDLATAASVAGLEKLTVDTYTGIGTSFTQGRLGAALPQAVVELLAVAGRQHQEHFDAWNRVLAAGGRPAVTGPDVALKPAVEEAFARVVDVPGAATLALRLEDYLSQTYLQAIPLLTSTDTVKMAAQILVVDQQHQAVLRYLLGLAPVGSGTGSAVMDFAPADPRPGLITG